MKDPKLEKVKDIISILQEEFIDTKFVIVNSEEDLERLKLETELKDKDIFNYKDFWSQDGLL